VPTLDEVSGSGVGEQFCDGGAELEPTHIFEYIECRTDVAPEPDEIELDERDDDVPGAGDLDGWE
jgi:hypothetical protein